MKIMMKFKLKKIIFQLAMMTFLASCSVSMGTGFGAGYDPQVPRDLSKELIIQTSKKYISKLERNYSQYQLRMIKSLSKTGDIYLFYCVPPPNVKMSRIMSEMKKDIRIVNVQRNKPISNR